MTHGHELRWGMMGVGYRTEGNKEGKNGTIITAESIKYIFLNLKYKK